MKHTCRGVQVSQLLMHQVCKPRCVTRAKLLVWLKMTTTIAAKLDPYQTDACTIQSTKIECSEPEPYSWLLLCLIRIFEVALVVSHQQRCHMRVSWKIEQVFNVSCLVPSDLQHFGGHLTAAGFIEK